MYEIALVTQDNDTNKMIMRLCSSGILVFAFSTHNPFICCRYSIIHPPGTNYICREIHKEKDESYHILPYILKIISSCDSV